MIHSTSAVKVLFILLFLVSSEIDASKKCYNISLASKDGWIYNLTSDWANRSEVHAGSVSYHLFDAKGTVILSSNANTSHLCLDDIEDDCGYLFLTGNGDFFIRKEQEELIEWEGELFYHQPKLLELGNCQHYCQDDQQLMVASEADNSPTIYHNNKVVDLGLFDKKHDNNNNKTIEEQNVVAMKTICVNPTDCYKLVGRALYILSDTTDTTRTIVEEGSTYNGFEILGNVNNCHSHCDDKPLLADTRRGQEIMPVVSSISGSELLKNTESPQYLAACWLIHDDLRQVNATDRNIVQRYILAVLYYALHGQDWNRNYDFLTSNHECEWRRWEYQVDDDGYYSVEGGVHCNQFGDVTGILMRSNNLMGTLPIEISWLVRVGYLQMYDNILSGTIPRELGNLKNLREIELSRNALTGSIPQTLGQITVLNFIGLGDNLLSGRITWNYGSNLKVFWLSNNVLSGTIANYIRTWSDLRLLSLDGNMFSGTIPNGIGNLTLLELVYMRNNNFVGTIPSMLLSLPRLLDLRLSENFLTGSIPDQVESESPLETIWLCGNRLTGTLPSELSQFTNLWDLDVHNNDLTGEIPSSFRELENLDWLYLQNNNITGIAPYENCKQSPANMEADCDTPQKVSCPCCAGCHGIFTLQNDHGLDCSSGEMDLIFQNLESGDRVVFYLYGFGGNLLAYEDLSADGTTHTYTKCLSASGCFHIEFENNLYKTFDLKILVNDNVVLDKEITEHFSSYYDFGYSSNGTMQENICSNFTLCNTVVEVDSAKRDLVDKLTSVTGIEVFQDSSSSHYAAACMWMKYLEGKTDDEYKQTRLAQYYYLALLYYETNGEQWANSTLWLKNDDICSWHGIACDRYQVVTAIRLGFNNLMGSIPTEIAELRGLEYVLINNNQLFGTIPLEIGVKLRNLKQFDISNNRLWGNLPSEFSLLGALTYLNLSRNQLTGSLPIDIGMLQSLQVLDLSSNTFSAELPDSFYDLTALKELSFGSNLFAGDVSRAETFLTLEILNLTNNFFTGAMPLGPYQKKLRVLQLSGNRFGGSISTTIEQLHSLEEVYLYNNELTGSLPSQFGNLQNLSKLSLSYNNIKGIIPSNIGRLENLILLHLHNNQLEGNGDFFDYEITDYITDCGNTFISPARVQCSNCSTCCNVEGDCLGEDITWPGQTIRKLPLSPVALVFLAALCCCISVLVFLFLFHTLKDMMLFSNFREGMQADCLNPLYFWLAERNIYVCQRFQQGSVYNFFISNSSAAKLFSSIVVTIQVMLLAIFITASDFSSNRNDWQYSFDCPESSVSCENRRHITKIGWCAFACILFCYLIRDLVEGIIMLNESIILKYWKGVFAGFVVLYITVCAAVASTLYNYSTSLSNTDLLKDAVILLFLNDIDEKVYLLLATLYPSWVSRLQKENSDYLDEMKSKINLRYGDSVAFRPNEEDNTVTIQNNNEDEEQRQNSFEGQESLELDFERAYRELESKIIALEDHVEANTLRSSENSDMAKMFLHEMNTMRILQSQEITEMKNVHAKEIDELKNMHDKEINEMKTVFESRQAQLEKEVHGLKKLLLSCE